FLVFAPLKKLLGVPTFPAAPIVLRSISFAGMLITLLFLWNFAVRHSGRLAASLAALVLLTSEYFLLRGCGVHPDGVQYALTLLVLLLAVRHQEHGDVP